LKKQGGKVFGKRINSFMSELFLMEEKSSQGKGASVGAGKAVA
jgi:hypothetical protein